ncbi:beta strand repeat-containing protein, partial [Sphingopyxis flava]
MTDFEAEDFRGFDSDGGMQQAPEAAPPPAAASGIILVPDAQGIVILPPGTSLEDVRAEGRDLVIVAVDGTRYVIPDGAVIVPQLVADGVAVPPVNLAALLLGNEIEPAAGPPQSSGGNFASDVGPIQAAFGLGDLLPYTELSFPESPEREVIPDLVIDEDPGVVIVTPDNPAGAVMASVTVNEAGLPARGGESAGSNAASNSETASGVIEITSGDGPFTVLIDGVAVTGVGQTFTTAQGTLTITSIAPTTIGFSYTLTDNLLGGSADGFAVTVIDSDGDSASGTIAVNVIDDAPVAQADAAQQTAENVPVTIDVLANDTAGADGVATSTVALVANSLTGAGALVLNPNGSFTYTPAPGEEGTVTFAYSITDGDGDVSTATVTITLAADSTPVIDVVPSAPNAAGHDEVDEAGLATGSDAAANSETASGTLTITTGNDTVGSLVINGTDVTAGGSVAGAYGTLTVTLAGGVYSYSYTLTASTDGDATADAFDVVVTDSDGDNASGTITVDIVDDVPTARDDVATQPAENAPVTIEVLANDTAGADGVAPSTVALVADSLTGAGALVLNPSGSFTYTPAPGEEGTVTFAYSITDGDGDVSTATVTITLAVDSTPVIDVVPSAPNAGGHDEVDEAGLATGSDSASNSEFASGAFTITTGNDTIESLVINGTDVTAGGTVAGAFGTLTVTLAGGVY